MENKMNFQTAIKTLLDSSPGTIVSRPFQEGQRTLRVSLSQLFSPNSPSLHLSRTLRADDVLAEDFFVTI